MGSLTVPRASRDQAGGDYNWTLDLPICTLFLLKGLLFMAALREHSLGNFPENRSPDSSVSVLVRVSVAVLKHHGQNQLGEKNVYFAHPSAPQFIKRSLAGTQGQTLEAGAGAEAALTGLLPRAGSATFLPHSRPPARARHYPQWAGPTHINY